MDESEMQTTARVPDEQWSSGLPDGHWRSGLTNAHFSSGLPEGHGSSSLHDGHRSSGYQLNPFLSELNGQHLKQTGTRVHFQSASTPIRQTLRQPAAAGNTTTMTMEETMKTNADTRSDGHQFQNGSSCKEDAIDINQMTPTCQAEKEMTPQKVTTGRKQLKVHKFDGSTSFDSYLAQFMNAASYNGWNKIDQLAHMKASLQGAAANVLWDTSADKTDTIDHLTSILHTRLGTMGMAERFSIDLRSKRRKPGETIQQLHLEVQRLASLAFPGPRSEAADIIARDAFIDSLDNDELALKIREREPGTLDDAAKIAIRLESYSSRRTKESTTSSKPTNAVRATTQELVLESITKRLELIENALRNGQQDSSLQEVTDRAVTSEATDNSNYRRASQQIQPRKDNKQWTSETMTKERQNQSENAFIARTQGI
jgi:hypothetical protein